MLFYWYRLYHWYQWTSFLSLLIYLLPSHTQKIVVFWMHRNNLKSILYVCLSQKTSWTKGLYVVNSILRSGITYTTMVRGEAIIHRKTFGVRQIVCKTKIPRSLLRHNSLGRNAERVKGMSNERTRQTAGIKFLFYLISTTSGFSKAKIKFLASDASRKPS